MARVTVEDCLDKVANRFKLVLAAAKRTRQLGRNAATPVVPRGRHKDTVLSLKEIASGKLEMQSLLSDFDVDYNEKPSKSSELFSDGDLP
jgi:DNA-directed RNA polymerase subunit omega